MLSNNEIKHTEDHLLLRSFDHLHSRASLAHFGTFIKNIPPRWFTKQNKIIMQITIIKSMVFFFYYYHYRIVFVNYWSAIKNERVC